MNTIIRNAHTTQYAIMCFFSDRGWRFLNGFEITMDPNRAQIFPDIIEATKALHKIDDTEYVPEVVRMEVVTTWYQPTTETKRRS